MTVHIKGCHYYSAKREAAAMAKVIEDAAIPPRSDKPLPVLEWWCSGCKKWYLWPHKYPPKKSVRIGFKWRQDGVEISNDKEIKDE